MSADPHNSASSAAAAQAAAAAAGVPTVTLGGRVFELHPMPWGKLKKVTVALGNVGRALASGVPDETSLDQMGYALALGLGISIEELENLPTDQHEIGNAFRALMKVTGMEQELEHNLGELKRRALHTAQQQHSAPSAPANSGTSSTPTPPASPAGPGSN